MWRPKVWMRHLASPEENRRFDLVALSQKPLNVLLLELVVVLVDLGSKLYFLDLDRLLVLPEPAGFASVPDTDSDRSQ